MRLYLLLLSSVRSFEKGVFSGDERVDKKELRSLIEEILEEKQLVQSKDTKIIFFDSKYGYLDL